MNQDKDLKVEVRRGKENKVKASFKGMLGWVFWITFLEWASIYTLVSAYLMSN